MRKSRSAEAAFAAAAVDAKAIQLPTTIDTTTIDANINGKATAATKIIQDQATVIYRIQEMQDKYAATIVGMCSYLQKHAIAYDIFSTEDNLNDIDTSRATTSIVGTVCPSTSTDIDTSKTTTSIVGTVCPSTATGEESTRYISSSLETTKINPSGQRGYHNRSEENFINVTNKSRCTHRPSFYRSSFSNNENNYPKSIF